MDAKNSPAPARVISAAEFPEVCKRLGIKPVRRMFFSDGGPQCGCRVAVCLAAAYGSFQAAFDAFIDGYRTEVELLADAIGESEEFCQGLSDGWEGSRENSLAEDNWQRGYAIGRDSWQACVDAGLVTA